MESGIEIDLFIGICIFTKHCFAPEKYSIENMLMTLPVRHLCDHLKKKVLWKYSWLPACTEVHISQKQMKCVSSLKFVLSKPLQMLFSLRYELKIGQNNHCSITYQYLWFYKCLVPELFRWWDVWKKNPKPNQTGLTLSKIIHRGTIALLSHHEVV